MAAEITNSTVINEQKKNSVIIEETEQRTPTSNENRSLLRRETLHGSSDFIRISQQKCSVENCLTRLVSLVQSCDMKYEKKRSKLLGLICILETLLLPSQNGFMTFNHAFELYSGYQEQLPDKEHFRDELLNGQYGLPIIIYTNSTDTKRFVLLSGNGLDVAEFLHYVGNSSDGENQSCKRFPLSQESVHKVLKSMDTEYDRECARALLSADKSRSDIYELGMDPDAAVKAVNHVNYVVDEIDNAYLAATDMLNLRLCAREEKLSNEIDNIKEVIAKNKDIWPQKRVTDLQETLTLSEERLEQVVSVQNGGRTKYGKQQFKQGVKRIADNLLEENRIKRRKLGQGAHRKVDTDDEEFMVKCIEDKATSHGRRHDSVLYLNHRVKAKDFKNTVNHFRERKGKKPIRSNTTMYNRSRPRNKRSLQSKRHIGKGLFCAKKPPKTEYKSNLCTHHQRCHVKNEKYSMFGVQNKDSWQFNLIISKDDKAYIRPGTDVGMTGARKQVIFQPTDEEKARKLPQHDFANSKVYITPATHRFIEKEGQFVADKEQLLTKTDQTNVVVRPKHYVPSDGTTWASDYMRLRHENPQLYEVDSNNFEKYSPPFRCLCAKVRDNTSYFIQTTMKEDVSCVTDKLDCCFKLYEKKRVVHFSEALSKAKDTWKIQVEMKEGVAQREIEKANELFDYMSVLTQSVDNAIARLETNPNEQLWEVFDVLLSDCKNIINKLAEFNLAPVKPCILELTDAGPGVGVSNFEVRFRDAEIALLHNSDRRARVHRATDDSGQNEAERSNACIGDAMVDGGSLEWEYYKQYDGLDEEELKNKSKEELEELEEKRMMSNAWRVAEDVRLRIDGEPAPKGFIHAIVSEQPGESFFYNKEYLSKYCAIAKSNQHEIPGHAYFSSVEDFFDSHYDRGELYMEYLKGDCRRKGELCGTCKENGWLGQESVKRTPRPYPDTSKHPSYHYLSIADTPVHDREPDDFQPRAQIRKLFVEGRIKCGDNEIIEQFAEKYIVKAEIVKEYLEHLTNIEIRKNVRKEETKRAKQDEEAKGYNDYSWEELFKSGTLKKLKVSELDKYILHHNLTTRKMKKAEKLELLSAHISKGLFDRILTQSATESTDTEENRGFSEGSECENLSEESESEDELLLEFGDESSSAENDSEVSEVEFESPIVQERVSRYGRRVGNWKLRYSSR